MKDTENFLATFIGEQVDILAKMARVDGLETLAFILQMAKAETYNAQKTPDQSRSNGQYRAN
jgi:hypothetical protein